MPYRYLEHIATADVAFEAWGDTPEEMFVAAADATMNTMVENLDAVSDRERRALHVAADALDMLLFQLLQELIFYKDAERLLLRVRGVQIRREPHGFALDADARGEEINPERHRMVVDVKAVTLHRFRVEHTPRGWKATVILDV